MAPRLTFEERLAHCDSPLLKRLYQIIIDKKSTLCVAADLDSIDAILKLVDQIGPHICMLKLHMELCQNNDENQIENYKRLYPLKKKYNFLLFEDRKFFDGGATVQSCVRPYLKYVDLVTIVPDFNDEIFKAIETATKEADLPEDEPRGCLAVSELSFKNVVRPDSQLLLEISQRNTPICVGIIAQKLNVKDPISMIKATPGVNMSNTSDGKNQQWRGPEAAVIDGADVIIVGRGITGQPEEQWCHLAQEYKERAFKAYLKAVA